MIKEKLGTRFLEDYLKEDVYFNTLYENENLGRARKLLEFAYTHNNK